MKVYAVLTFAVVAALCIAISHCVSSRYGSKGMHDQMVHREYVIKPKSWLGRISTDVVYPPKGYMNSKVISAVYCIDGTGGRNTTTGYASLTEGGPGHKNVTIHIKAPYRRDVNFTVEIYASPYFS